MLGDGFVSVDHVGARRHRERAGRGRRSRAFGGAITASLVPRTATATGKGVKYRGSVLDLVVGEREIGTVEGRKTFTSTPARSSPTTTARA